MQSTQKHLFRLLDVIGMAAAFLAASGIAPILYRQLSAGGALHSNWIGFLTPARLTDGALPLNEYAWVFVFFTPATILCIGMLGGYRPIRQLSSLRILVVSAIAPLVAVAMLSTVFLAVSIDPSSRLFIFSFAFSSSLTIAFFRFAGRSWRRYALRRGMHAEEVAIVGRLASVKLAAERIRQVASPQECQLVGCFSLPAGAEEVEIAEVPALKALGSVDDMEKVFIHQAIQRVVMVLPEDNTRWLDRAVAACDCFRVAVDIVPEAILRLQLTNLAVSPGAGPGSLPSLTLMPVEVQQDWLPIKRVLDVCVSASLLFLLSPVFAMIALAIRVTTPKLRILYPWHVVGYRGRRFTGYKFATMVADADDKRAELEGLNEMTGPVFKIANDPRVTPLGRFLRKYSLNELPQLWSVLKGDMSMVGPRPAGANELERYELWHKRKLTVQPGITCFWQVRGRNRISNFDDWVRMDLEYIHNRSAWLDCKLLVKTAWVVLRGTGS